MEPEIYEVGVLHIENPHLLWVEIIKHHNLTPTWEQIGIYGVLPCITTLSLTSKLHSERCDKWQHAAYEIIQEQLRNAKKVWFTPTDTSSRTSIFDNSYHKFGEIILQKDDGKLKKLSKLLIKSGFASYDADEFEDVLKNDKLQIYLNKDEIKALFGKIENHYINKRHPEKFMNALKSQTSMSHTAHKLESALTINNINRHNKIQTKGKDLNEMFEKKRQMENHIKVDVEPIESKKSTSRSGYLLAKMRNRKDNENTLIDTSSSGDCPDSFKKVHKTNRHGEETAASKGRRHSFEYEDPITGQRDKGNAQKSSNRDIHVEAEVSTTKHNHRHSREYDDTITTEVKVNRGHKHSSSRRDGNDDEEWSTARQTHHDHTGKVRKHSSSKPTTNSAEDDQWPPRQTRRRSSRELDQQVVGDPVFANESLERNENVFRKPVQKVEINEQVVKVKAHKTPGQAVEKPKVDVFKESFLALGPPGFNPTRLPSKVTTLIRHEVKLQRNTEVETAAVGDIQETAFSSDIDNDLNEQNLLYCKNRLVKDELFSGSEESATTKGGRSVLLQKLVEARKAKVSNSSSTNTSLNDSTSNSPQSKKSLHNSTSHSVERNKDNVNLHDSEDDVTEQIEKLIDKLRIEPLKSPKVARNETDNDVSVETKKYINPFKNLDSNISGFVDKLVCPVLMVHSKMNIRIQPTLSLNDVGFDDNIRVTLKNIGIEKPMTLQRVAWFSILRGYSVFMVSPMRSGKTLGYVPPVCQLVVNDICQDLDSAGPICIIVCATAQAVNQIEYLCKKLLGFNGKVFGCYAGVDSLTITTSLLNGCDILVVTPSMLTRLVQDMSVSQIDLSRLQTFVLDDCERLSQIYSDEIKLFNFKIKEMLKLRVNNELKIQYIVASREWCDFMEPLARNVPNAVICIRAFQECVLYSKTNTSVDFVKSSNKIKVLLQFLSEIDISKRIVVVCSSNEEVESVKTTLKHDNYIVFACDNSMDLHELYNLNVAWNDYEEPTIGPILVCCDYNLTHLNITDANYLVHFSLPQLFSMFCKRFSVLNEHYPSIFREKNADVKVKILLENANVEQLPKIINFIKRCSSTVPEVLDEICGTISLEKDLFNSKNCVPLCDDLLAYGECPDYWNCKKRHKVFEVDVPQEWVPKEGIVSFKILHYHTPIQYSARLLSNSTTENTRTYPQSMKSLSMKMGMFYSKKANKRLHGIPKIGHICAAEIKPDLYVRCQVLNILSKDNSGNPNLILVNLIDEQRPDTIRGLSSLYFLPDELRSIQTYVIQVRLANILPKDKDVTFPHVAREKLKQITEKDDSLFMRGKIVMAIGNCVFVDDLEVCADLKKINEIVVQHNFKKDILELYAVPNTEHIPKLEKLCKGRSLDSCFTESKKIIEKYPERTLPEVRWAYLDSDDFSSVYFASAENPNKFFVRLVKFAACMNSLIKDIKRYIEDEPLEPLRDIARGDIVLAEFPDDRTYERARVDDIMNKNKIKCFFVDQGDWREVSRNKLLPITEKLIHQLPFQAIECRLIGVQPFSDNWSEFSTNVLCDNCFDKTDSLKEMYVKYFKKEKAECTGGHKYSVIMVDTSGEEDIVLNKKMIELNLVEECTDESQYFDSISIMNKVKYESEEEKYDDLRIPSNNSITSSESIVVLEHNNELLKAPIRSVPLVASDEDSDDVASKWDFNMVEEFTNIVGATKSLPDSTALPNLTTLPSSIDSIDNISINSNRNSSSISDFEILPSPNLKEQDSDDLTSPESSLINMKIIRHNIQLKESETKSKPKVSWRQTKTSVSFKILLVGVQEYKIEWNQRTLKFFAEANDVKYGFEFELYGVIDSDKSSHSNKGQYILVKLFKVLPKNWLYLTKNDSFHKWITVDADAIDTSSDEEQETILSVKEKKKLLIHKDSESDEEDFCDDVQFSYKRDSD